MVMGYCSWVETGLVVADSVLEKENFWPHSPYGEMELMMNLFLVWALKDNY